MKGPVGRPPDRRPEALTRRDVLRAGSIAALGTTLPANVSSNADASSDHPVSCILLLLLGGPSQLDTWDLKPDAPAEVRGPFRPIETNVPGLWIGEIFPRMARVMDKVALVRSVHHRAVPVHDAGLQLIQTGRLATNGGITNPHHASVLAYFQGPSGHLPPHVILPGPLGSTGGNMDRVKDRVISNVPWGHRRLNSNPTAGCPEAIDLSLATPSGWATKPLPCSTVTDGPNSAGTACWPVGWSSVGSAS